MKELSCYNSSAYRADIHLYCPKSELLSTLEECQHRDAYTLHDIERLENLIADLKEYRQMIAARAALLTTAVYDYQLSFIRKRRYKGDVSYYVKLEKVFGDPSIPPQPVISETYSGNERHKARARFEQLKKQRPGIATFIDIEKAYWER